MTFNLPLLELEEINQLIYPKSLLLEFDLISNYNLHECVYEEMSIIIYYSISSFNTNIYIYRYVNVNEFNLLTATSIQKFTKYKIHIQKYNHYKKYRYIAQKYSINIPIEHIINNWEFLNELAQDFTKLTDQILETP